MTLVFPGLLVGGGEVFSGSASQAEEREIM